MKKGLVLVGIAVVAIIGFVVWKNRDQKKVDGPTQVKVPEDKKPEKAEKKPRISKHYVVPEIQPMGYEGFCKKSQMERLNQVTAEMEKRNTPESILNFYKMEIFNRNHWDVTRNNMANSLVWCDKPDPNLHELFIEMLDDDNEDPVWRDYCIQFLSECLKSTAQPEVVRKKIAEYAKGTDGKAGTAIVHMALREDEGRMQLSDGFSQQVAEQLENEKVSLATRMSILGVIGKRKDIKQLHLVRKYAKQDEVATLKRCAIGAIGVIAADPEKGKAINQSDVAIVKAALTHKNRAVQMAAKGALKRIEAAAAAQAAAEKPVK